MTEAIRTGDVNIVIVVFCAALILYVLRRQDQLMKDVRADLKECRESNQKARESSIKNDAELTQMAALLRTTVSMILAGKGAAQQ